MNLTKADQRSASIVLGLTYKATGMKRTLSRAETILLSKLTTSELNTLNRILKKCRGSKIVELKLK